MSPGTGAQENCALENSHFTRGATQMSRGIRLVQKFTQLGLFFRTRHCTRVYRLGVQKRAKLEKKGVFFVI